MKKIVAVLCIGLFVVAANAADFRLFFSTTPYTAGIAPAPEAPVVVSGTEVYLWAITDGQYKYDPAQFDNVWDGDRWNGVSLDINYTGAANIPQVTVPNLVGRFDSGADLTGFPFNLTAVTARGIGGAIGLRGWDVRQHTVPAYDPNQIPMEAKLYTWVGGGTPSGFVLNGNPGDEFRLVIGQGGIALAGGTQSEKVWFGDGSEWLYNANKGGMTKGYNAKIIPEPASLLLLGLAGLALRRR